MRYTITFDTAAKMQMAAGINAALFPLLNQAVNAVAQATSANWKEAVYRARIWSGEKDAYANSISYKMTGPLSAEVTADYSRAYDIENGQPPRDLKKMLNTSSKVRRTKDGRRFLVIPFRHNEDKMPAGVHDMAKGLSASTVTGTGTRPTGQIMNIKPGAGMTPARKQTGFLTSISSRKAAETASRTYSWGDRLKKSDMRAAGIGLADRKRYGGMVRFDTSTPGAPRSTFATFRIMMEGSSGWVVKAKPGMFLAKKVAETMQPKAEAAFTEAVKRSLR